jgi:Ca2+-binding RTX toxin-like protein
LKTLLRRPLRLALLFSVLGLATASAASAATVTFDGTTMTFTADPGEINHVSVTQSGSDVTITDTNATTAPAGCTQNGADSVICPSVTAIAINLGDMNDSLASNGTVTVPETVDGGDGNDCDLHGGLGDDVIHGGPGNDCVYGDPPGGSVTAGGNDHLYGDAGDDFVGGGRGDDFTSGGDGSDYVTGGPGTDIVNGDAGEDTVNDGPGAPSAAALTSDPTLQDSGDVVSGGSGIDTYQYFLDNNNDTTSVVTLTLDGVANDGLPGENDNISTDVEDIQANVSNPTTITGSAVTNSISGSNGNDTITPAAGNDFVFANNGDDTIDAVDGYADRVDCGDGTDVANVDEFDQVADNCETVNRTTLGSFATEDKPPTIAWLTPAENAVMSTTAPNTLSVNASDDRGISKVVFLAGERVLCTVTAAPYTCAYTPIDADVGKDTLTAMVIDTSQQSATALRTVTVPRFAPSKVTSKTTPSRDRTAPFTFRTRGTVVLPTGVTTALGCHGVVTVIFKAGGKTVSARNANLSRTCTFSRKVTFSIPRRLHPKTLKVEVRFRGNAVLSAKSAPSRRVKVS